ncbi:hypothetical protein Aple_046590 [Acrocarpospora pleiomorpha]|uniref:Uncharacterized protein n=1 Tax=Acrocarpospora pleiomorpha TaxID=90975 RepID=A0A5M3XRG8_9ACTN|nr:hypothetical protein Aple_046590 [Acrocarpospora pleiomorpha]
MQKLGVTLGDPTRDGPHSTLLPTSQILFDRDDDLAVQTVAILIGRYTQPRMDLIRQPKSKFHAAMVPNNGTSERSHQDHMFEQPRNPSVINASVRLTEMFIQAANKR